MSSDGFEEGDLIEFKTWFGYNHWAVYVGDGEIVHYAKINSDGTGAKVKIARDCLDDYIRNCSKLELRSYAKKELGVANRFLLGKIYSGKEVAGRALSKVGEEGYDLIFKNCEHFAKWCKYDTPICEQTEDAVEGGTVVTGLVAGAVFGGAIGIIGGPPGMALGAFLGGAAGLAAGGAGALIHWGVTIIGRKKRRGEEL